jgi:maltose alpha-D-glucosyltransferase/alpha-amylase
MGADISLPEREAVRTPMQWNGDRNAGFSTANPQQLFLPLIIDPEYHYETVNVEAQQGNPRSLWWWMKRTIALRRQHPVFGRGSIRFLQPDNPKVLAYLRESDDERVLVVANLSRHAQACELDLAEHAGEHLVEMFGSTAFPQVTARPYALTLGPYGHYWFQLEQRPLHVTYAGVSTTGPAVAVPQRPTITTTVVWPRLGEGGTALNRALPDMLGGRRWFGGKGRTVRRAGVVDSFRLPGTASDAALVLGEVEYATGDPDLYCLVLGFAEDGAAESMRRDRETAVLADVVGRAGASDGVLFDAVVDEATISGLVELVRRAGTIAGRNGSLNGVRVGQKLAASAAGLPSRPLGVEQSNTSVVIGDAYVMKLVRRLNEGVNPDLEVGRFLTEQVGFEHTPKVVGAVEHRGRRGEVTTVAVMTAFVPNEGDAWAQALGGVDRFLDEVLAEHADLTVPTGSPLQLARKGLPDAVADQLGPATGAARLLGLRTAQLHAALAADSEDPAFAPEDFTTLYQRSLYQSMRTRTRRGEQALARALRVPLPDEVRRDITDLLAHEGAILARFEHLKTQRLSGRRTRTHGDYHLGQVLWTGRDYQIIDFEGEPAAPVSERRIKRSPLRDVAGMLRSLQYAAHVGARSFSDRGLRAADDDTLTRAADWWGAWAGAAFLEGYLIEAPPSVLPETDEEVARLLDAYLLEKALYELEYELDNRPSWIPIPLGAIRAVVLGDDA